ncbi:hypothetical protein AT5G23510 [Arabidopsis thaliana]|uniref:At5g23510 n=1 Tax=Arabidopsis thaliana TaxID=3702 RepID=Q1ECD6_ARATH|nr:uncharacterized protein AT5G23510 [Arabidopsis thaliana]ABF83688.1 At5g23510 [Arabidopsis thaliana]AED93176.1 hypothetical protein AT5G23510 [Arabidopsis thaliana]|eukprot:NP_197742.2 hypothetical protein AT5G23510 [Arabidopsis thaliana]
MQPGTSVYESPALNQADETPPISKTVVNDTKNIFYFDDGDDAPLPALENLQISGEPYPGHELQACGYSINGTTSCNFEWVCHLEDGSVNYIDGAKKPNYLVTADDVGLCLAIEVQPLDDRNRKGELVKVFANDNRKIACHPEMQSNIDKTLHTGHASYKVSLAIGFVHIWEAATLSIEREGYTIKCNNDLTITEKFSASTAVKIPFEKPAELVIIGSDGSEHCLRVDNEWPDISSRDEIVLTLRSFIKTVVFFKALQFILSLSLQSLEDQF